MLENPYVFDLMQEDILNWEWSVAMPLKKKYKPERYMGTAAALMGSYVRVA